MFDDNEVQPSLTKAPEIFLEVGIHTTNTSTKCCLRYSKKNMVTEVPIASSYSINHVKLLLVKKCRWKILQFYVTMNLITAYANC